MANKKGQFKLIKKTKFQEFENSEPVLPESDLCFQNEDTILQFEYVREDEEDIKYEVKPGVYQLANTPNGVRPKKTELRKGKLLESIDNTQQILKEAQTFFSKLDIYEKLERPKKRGVLLYSSPGMGKTSAIAKFCNDFALEDPGTIILNWPTSELESDDVARFLTIGSEYTKECTRLVLIMEDIGGGERENGGHTNSVDSGLLNLLDGVGITFKLPTFIVATTNYPENLLGALANRPGRFDLMMKLEPPSVDEKVKLMEFIARRQLTNEEKQAVALKDCKEFSIAHLEEVVVRSMLHDKSIPDVIHELIEHQLKFNRSFSDERQKLGI